MIRYRRIYANNNNNKKLEKNIYEIFVKISDLQKWFNHTYEFKTNIEKIYPTKETKKKWENFKCAFANHHKMAEASSS